MLAVAGIVKIYVDICRYICKIFGMIRFQLFLLFVCITFCSFSQQSVTLMLNTVSAHPFTNQNLSLHQNTLDSEGYLTLEPGLRVAFESKLNKTIDFHASGNAQFDRFAGSTASLLCGVNVLIYKNRRNSLRFGIGPAVFFASKRSTKIGYVNEENFVQGNFPANYKLSYISGFLEYDVILNKQTAFTLALTHSQPMSVGLAAGVRFRKVGGGKGCNCPSYK